MSASLSVHYMVGQELIQSHVASQVDVLAASKLHPRTLAVTNEEAETVWLAPAEDIFHSAVGSTAILGILKLRQLELFQAVRWLAFERAGLSSKTMLAAAIGIPNPNPQAPVDSGDFGRCLSLLRSCPWVRDRFEQVAAVSHAWLLIIEVWDILEEAFNVGASAEIDWTLREAHKRSAGKGKGGGK